MTYEFIRYERAGVVGVVTLNRPEKLNAFTPLMRAEIQAALKEADADSSICAIVITGAGRGFCSGVDLSTDPAKNVSPPIGTHEPYADIPDEGRLVMSIHDLTKPVIGAINGVAIGAGLTMTLPMDFRIVSREAKLSFAFPRLGFVPEMASAWFLPRIVGHATAMDWLGTGRQIDPEEGRQAGLFNHVVEPDQLMPQALALGAQFADSAPVSVAIARRMLQQFQKYGSPVDALRIDGPAVRARLNSNDVREAMAARAEKRAPNFKDKATPEFLQQLGLGTDRQN